MTEVVFILDRSGSMSGSVADTIGGFNAMLEQQRTGDDEVLVTTVLFDNRIERLHDRLPLQQVPKLTDKEYFVRGTTALLDAVGSTIRHIARIHKYARAEDRPDKTIFFITTDGLENASHHYSYRQVQQLITLEQEKYGWEFIFLAAGIDAAREARRMGIRADRALNFCKLDGGIDRMYSLASDVVRSAREDDPFEDILRVFAADERNK